MPNMYSIKVGTDVIYHPLEESLAITSAVLNYDMNKADMFSMVLPSGHPFQDRLSLMTSIVKVYNGTTLMFMGRVVGLNTDIWNNLDVVCEGCLAWLNDSIVRPYSYSENTMVNYVDLLIGQHNSQVDSSRQFTLGNVTIEGPNQNGNINRATAAYPTTFNELINKTVNMTGGFIQIRYDSNEMPIIDILADSNIKSNQPIDIADNIIDLKFTNQATDIITAVIPLGAVIPLDEPTLDDGEEDDPQESIERRVTISSVNGGVDYVFNQTAVDTYGYIFKTVLFDDISDPDELLLYGQMELAKNLESFQSFELTALDLARINVDMASFKMYQYVDINAPSNGITGRAMITKQSFDLLDPTTNMITLGSEFGRFTYTASSSDDKLGDLIVTGPDQTDSITINNTIKRVYSTIQQTADSIRTEVGQIIEDTDGKLREQISTVFEQLNDMFNFNFSYIEEIIQGQGNETNIQFQEIFKYIRFLNGEIWIGESASPFQLQITNTTINFLQEGAAIAYISNNQLFITNGQFLQNLRIGNFIFSPKTNGNLTLQKV